MRVRRILAGVVTLALCLSARARAQAVRGIVRDSANGQAVIGAVVMLLDSAGGTLRRDVTNERGQYRLAASAGVRSLRVMRIGYRMQTVRVPAGEAQTDQQLDVRLSAIPTLLEPVRVASGASCPRRDDRLAALALLEQARAALLGAVVAREVRSATMIRLVYKRTFDDHDRIATQQVQLDSSGGVARSFLAVRSAADFVRLGFRGESDQVETYYGPDAETLLDDAFRDGYCFELRRAGRDRPNQIGLRFVPARTARGRIDIDGTLWIDTTARELRDIDYRYTNLARGANDVRPGGNISFRTVGNGVSLIDRWHFRLPAAQQDTSYDVSGRQLLNSYYLPREAGGEVARAVWPDGFSYQASLGVLRLRPVDKLGHPVQNVTVRLDDTDYIGSPDSTGLIEIRNLLPGPYQVTVADPALSSIGVLLPTDVRIEAERAKVVQRPFVVPTALEFVRKGCAEVYRHQPDSTAAWLVGRAFRADGRPMGSRQWNAARIDIGGSLGPIADAQGVSGSDGVFFGCGGYAATDRLVVSVRDERQRWLEVTTRATGRLTVIRVDPGVP